MPTCDSAVAAQLRDTLSSYLGRSERYSLPPQFYTSEELLAYEVENLLRREWLCLGRVDELAECGDYFTVEMLGEPLLVVRGDDHRVRVLSNVCRHRNMLVAQGSSAANGIRPRNFVCPYHAWTYGRDGAFQRAPTMGTQTGFEKKASNLPELRAEQWQGFLYVNLDGQAAPLAPRLMGLDAILENYHTAEMHHVSVAEEVWDANWKCLVENFMEGYHLSIVHPRTLGGRTPTRLCEKFEGGEAYTGYRAGYPESAPHRGDCHPDLTERERSCSTLFAVFPCHVVSQAPDVLVYMSLWPAGIDRVSIRWGLSLYDADLPATEVRQRIELWHAINAEDRAKLAQVQRGLGSRFASIGPLGPPDYEGTIWDFYQYLARTLGAGSITIPDGSSGAPVKGPG